MEKKKNLIHRCIKEKSKSIRNRKLPKRKSRSSTNKENQSDNGMTIKLYLEIVEFYIQQNIYLTVKAK